MANPNMGDYKRYSLLKSPVMLEVAAGAVETLLKAIGENPKRPGLVETPMRVAKAWAEWTSGYDQDPGEILKTFEDGAKGVDEMVVVKDIEIYSHCEHHLAPFFGVAHIAYIPNGKIVGLSKLARLADVFAHRLQVQERLTNEIAQALVDHLDPIGVGVVIEAKHFCMCSRGIKKQGSSTITSALRGAIKDQDKARAEFMAFVKG
ncbi:GTP cyclohydrolase I [Edwardsiella phage vB_EpM_ZHS]|jgi:GTP cyclohydrolase I|nr:GTP cyclohydrolase I [Edwardsiella phage vB_EpM_ZHS]